MRSHARTQNTHTDVRTRTHTLIHTLPHYKTPLGRDIMSKVLTHLQTIYQTPHTQACSRSCLCPHTGRDIATQQTGIEMKPAFTDTSRCIINGMSNHFRARALAGLHENDELEDLRFCQSQSSPLFCDWQICDSIWVLRIQWTNLLPTESTE